MNIDSLTALLILLPMFMALTGFINNTLLQRSLTGGFCLVIAVASLALLANGPFSLEPATTHADWHTLLSWADFILLGIILTIALLFRHKLSIILVILQLIPLTLIKASKQKNQFFEASIAADQLSLILVLIVCFVGSLIILYALEYMRVHSDKHDQPPLQTGIFLFFLIFFLGAMNGLVLSNNLLWMFFFWELTTLCSFVLIAHNRTDEAITSALRALWINLLGGVCFIWAIYLLHLQAMPLEINSLIALASHEVLYLPVALLCIAALTKSAQLPFQSWLTGAMVAPAPVSALLHSSTMVNAGVFLILKLAPVYHGSSLAIYLTILGALTFLCTSILAVTQSNAKKILAYSTIGTLGLIIACAGIGTPQAYSAAILLIIFHAVAKGLLFMGVGRIEQITGSKSIEHMWGLMAQHPRISILLVLGMISMFLPPFGALVSKWMAVHAAAQLPVIVVMLALGSAFTVIYWTRWAGLLINTAKPAQTMSSESRFIEWPLTALGILGIILSIGVLIVYKYMAIPLTETVFAHQGPFYQTDLLFSHAGAFIAYPVFLIISFLLLRYFSKADKDSRKPDATPYYSGLNQTRNGIPGFYDPLGTFVPFVSGNYYLQTILPEQRVSLAVNIAASGFIILLLAASL
ncbi:NADH-quinone oxidoreductase subunit 5 family protein [Desulfonatronovibrio magnus]|uniref:NADH-quinone oxidoreductase subunit 5 family protein n=1 Tax=Desulfonatronovibrio magnus TaxID=698827 RepID=UPI0005EB067D|nr:proton-conducting transporter membrane subunit [Desulfonatronovibrio magnus]